MTRDILRPLLVIVAGMLGVAAMSTAAAASDRYDVSYIWSRSLPRVQDYRERVAGVLGPAVTDHLRVVAEEDLFGLVYVRHGDHAGATRVANVHTRLLQSRGLEPARPVRSKEWEVLDIRDDRRELISPVGVPHDSGNELTETEPSPEILDLEAAVEDYISRMRREGKIKTDERTAWSVYDFTTGEKLVSINEDEQFEAASMVKLFIAAAFFCKVERGS